MIPAYILTIAAFLYIAITYDGLHSRWESVFPAALGGLICFGLGTAISYALPADMEVKSSEYRLETLQDNSTADGRFMLGYGSIDGTMKYAFYYRTNGGFKLKLVDYKQASIYYSDTPKVVQHRTVPTESPINWFALDRPEIWYDIYVPKGTITNEFRLDAR